jgi:AraC-like DNA-binding protein
MAASRSSTPSDFTVSADLITGIVDCAVKCGLPRARFDDLINSDPNARRPTRYAGAYIVRVWERVARVADDPIIGLRMAQAATLKSFGALGQVLPSSSTVLDALRQTARYSALASQGTRVSVASHANTIGVTFVFPERLNDVALTISLWGLTNMALVPLRVAAASEKPLLISCTLPSPSPSTVRALRQHYPFEFNAEEDSVLFEKSVGAIRVPTADADLQTLLAETMDRHLAALGPAASFEQGMLSVLRTMLNGEMPTLASLARRSGMSQRTLQRRLAESGTSFQSLLRHVLRETSDQYLARGRLSHGEIAFLLGYSEESAFSRAYRSWTGHPPSEARVAYGEGE